VSLYHGISNRMERSHLNSGAKASCMRLFVDLGNYLGMDVKGRFQLCG
jgi:hypothetical protein